MVDPAPRVTTGLSEAEAVTFAELVKAHQALLRAPAHIREAAWTRFLDALRLFLSEQPRKDS
jgi:hypothetical protein